MRIVNLSTGAFVNKHGVFNFLPLYEAAANGDIEGVQARLEAGVDPNHDEPAIVVASKNGSLEIVKILTKSHTENTEKKANRLIDEAKQKIMARTDDQAISINMGNLKTVAPSFKSNKYLPIIHQRDHHAIMKLFKRFDHNHEKLNKIIEDIVDTALFKGLHVILIFKHDGSVKTVSYDKSTDPIQLQEIIQEFLEKTNGYHDYYLILFTDPGNVDVIEAIISSQYKKIDKGMKAIVEAIDIARSNKHFSIAAYLESQQDVNVQDKNGNTLLHKAVENGEVDRVLEIIAKGADVNIKNNEYQTAIRISASRCGHECDEEPQFLAIMGYLLEKSAKVEASTLLAAIQSNSPT